MTRMILPRRVFVAVALLMIFPAIAHHSSAMYDQDKLLSLKGEVKAFQWTNPHCWIQLSVSENGAANEWSVQMGPPGNLYRDGWRPGTVKAGDSITVVVHPMLNGTPGGLWVSGIGSDGKAIGLNTSEK